MSSNSTIAKQVISELETVQSQLNTFKGNVAYLTDAKNQIENAKRALNNSEIRLKEQSTELSDLATEISQLTDSSEALFEKINSIDFPDRLEKIENAAKVSSNQINKTREVTVSELKALAVSLKKSAEDSIDILDKTGKIAVKEVRDLNAQLLKADIPGTLKELKISTEQKHSNTLEAIAALKKENIPAKLVELENNNKKHLGNLVADLNASIAEIGKQLREINFQKRFDKIDNDNQVILDGMTARTEAILKKQNLLLTIIIILFLIGLAVIGYGYIKFR